MEADDPPEKRGEKRSHSDASGARALKKARRSSFEGGHTAKSRKNRKMTRRRSGTVSAFLAPKDTDPVSGKRLYRYGSHSHPPKGTSDPRFRIFKPEWFRGKRCLEIGCNNGDLAFTIAREHAPLLYEGVDLDARLISAAKRTWRTIASTCDGRFPPSFPVQYGHTVPKPAWKGGEPQMKAMAESVEKSPPTHHASATLPTHTSATPPAHVGVNTATPPMLDGREDCEEHMEGEEEEDEENTAEASSDRQLEFPYNLTFTCENFIASEPTKKNAYDTILCLNVTKWVQLNWGDDGIRALFNKALQLLRPGGVFILEAQPLCSYRQTRPQTAESRYHMQTMQLLPKTFKSLLVKEFNLTCVWKGEVLEDSKRGYYRDVLAFQKHSE